MKRNKKQREFQEVKHRPEQVKLGKDINKMNCPSLADQDHILMEINGHILNLPNVQSSRQKPKTILGFFPHQHIDKMKKNSGIRVLKLK